MLAGRLPSQGNGLADPRAEGIHKDTDGPDQASDSVEYFAHLPGRYLALADFCASSCRLGHGPHLLPPRQGHECSGRRCHGRHHPSCQRAPTALLGLHNTGIPRRDSRPCGHRRRRYPSRASWSPVRSDGRGHSTRPGACPSGRGRSAPSGTGILSPYARHVPGREKMHPHAQHVPGRGKDAMWAVRNGAARDSRVVRLT